VLTRHTEAIGADVPPAEVAELHRELGDVLAGHLARPESAARAFKTAIELDPANTGALQGLKQIHLSSGHREAYLEIEENEIASSAKPDPARYAGVAEEWEARDAFDRASGVWRKVLDLEPKNQVAHAGLARVLRKLSRWDELATARRTHLKFLKGADRIPVLLDLASALEDGLEDLEAAIKACEEVLTITADHAPAQDALSRLYESHGRLNEALASLERRAQAGGLSDRERADLQQRMGHIQASRGDLTAATACFERAIAIDTRNAGGHEGLGRIYRNRQEWALASHHFTRAAQLSSGADAVRCLMEAADIHWQRMNDAERARECLERALESEPGNERVRVVLAKILQDAGKWEALWPHISTMATRAEQSGASTPPEARRDLYLRAARCAVEIGKSARALELLDLAQVLDPADVDVQLARADALYRGESWDAAAKLYNTVLVQHDITLDKSQIAGVYRRLALIHKQLGKEGQASAFYKKVLEIDSSNRQTLEELVDLDVGRKRFDEAIATLRTLIGVVPSGEHAAILERIGDLYATELKDGVRAASTYQQAIELDARSHRVLQKLLDVQSEAGQWKEALGTIGRFIALESEPFRRSTYFMAAATIRRLKLQEPAGALEDYERALDALVEGTGALSASSRGRALEALQSISELVAEQKDWKRQERAYRKLIKRLPMEDPTLIDLWQALGDIYRTRMEDPESAIVAFETAHALDPAKKPERVKIISDLYAQVGSSSEQDMVERASRLVESDPTNPETFRALARACTDANRMDEAWCVCRALVFLKQAKPAEEQLYKKHQASESRRAEGVLDHDSWRWVRDADEDRIISAVFSVIWEAPVALRAGPPKSFGLKDKDKLKADDARPIGKTFQHAARVLNTPLPSVYVQTDRSGRLMLANCIESKRLSPSLIVGRDLSGFRDEEVVYSVASMMALLRPAYYLRLALPTIDELEAALAAAATAVGKHISVRPEPAAAAGAFVPEIKKRLTPQATEALAGLIARLPDKPDLQRWRNAVDAAGRRAGLLVCGDLAAATAVISAEPALTGSPRNADKVRDLVIYSVSPDYFAARRHLGVTVT
jgi:tetratricopeptide (TPR) repeat protein